MRLDWAINHGVTGGASVNFTMLITARACQGAFAALLVPSALSLLTTTFTGPKDRGRAFGVYGAIAGAGGAVGLLLGGALTEYLSWRWTLYVNLIFAAAAFTGGALLLARPPSRTKPKLDVPGVLLVSGALFCLVYGFANAATHSWAMPSTWGFLAAGVALGAAFAAWQGRAAHPLLPPRVVLDRNRGGAYLSMLIASAGSRLRHRHRRPATRRLGRHLAAEHHLHRRRHRLPHRAPGRGPAHRPPGPDRAGAGARLRHRVLVDRRHLRRRRGHRRRPAPPRATAPGGHDVPRTGRSAHGTSQGGPGSSGLMSAAPSVITRTHHQMTNDHLVRK